MSSDISTSPESRFFRLAVTSEVEVKGIVVLKAAKDLQ
jgi:hypothetical protein